MSRLPLILASASPRRRELIELLGVPFEVIPSTYEEPAPDDHPFPDEFARALALGKAEDVAHRHPGRMVLGADTLVVLEHRLLAKPRDAADAARMLRELSGRTHRVITGVGLVVRGIEEDLERCFHTTTEVTFRELEESEIRAYVATGEPMDKAGAYGIQGHGGLLIHGIRGDYNNVVGLPVTDLALTLRELGLPILGK